MLAITYLVSTLAPLASWLRPIRPLSPWYQTLGVDPIGQSFAPARLAVLLVTAVTVAGAVRSYDRCDLAV